MPKAKMIQAIFALVVLAGTGLATYALKASTTMESIASFTTDLAPRSSEQRHNILRAAARLDGVLVRPGEEFSFNRTVGQCGLEQGYELAPAIIAGEMRQTWGGGVCQVSSTLYNAALLADLKITERHPHTRKASSVPPGRDATTAFGVADLRFVNTTGSPLRIRARSAGNMLTVSLLGHLPAKANVEIFTKTCGRLQTGRSRDSRSGEETYLTYRIVQRYDGNTKRELLSTDTYLGSASLPAGTR